MRTILTHSVPALVLILALAAYSSSSDQAGVDASTAGVVTESAAPEPPASSRTAQNLVPEAAAPSPVSAGVLGLEGLGNLRIGEQVPRSSSWAERGPQTGDACRTVTSLDYPGVYAIVSEGKVRRITVGQRSDVKLAEGLGIGATEKDVKKWFGRFREEPHKYEDAPAKYLTAPNASSGDLALRFEIGRDGKVSLMHVGTMPVLGYVEGCS